MLNRNTLRHSLVAFALVLLVSAQPAGRSKTARVKRTSREVESLIRRVGPTKPDWWDDVKLDYPKTLDLSWPRPKKGAPWNQNKNPGQYMISVIYRQPKKWRGAAKLFKHIIDINDDNDYAWDFYKLFGRKTAAGLFVGRVAGKADDHDVFDRIGRLAATLEREVVEPFEHLLYPGQPLLVVLVPGSVVSKVRIGAIVAPARPQWRTIQP